MAISGRNMLNVLIVVLSFLMITGCGSYEGSSTSDEGYIQVNVIWSSNTVLDVNSSDLHAAAAPAGVQTVRMIVEQIHSVGDNPIIKQKDFPASDGQGVIGGLAPGAYNVIFQGLDSVGTVMYEGARYDIQVNPGETTNVGTVIMAEKWDRTVIGSGGGNVQILIDSLDNIHVLYGVVHTRKTTNASGVWITNTVAEDWTLRSAAIGPDDSIYMTGNPSGYSIELITNATGPWTNSIINGSSMLQSSIDIDATGNAHVAYYGGDWKLYYASNASGSWSHSLLEPDTYPFSLKVDSSGNIHIFYKNESDNSLVYTTNGSGVWVKETIDHEVFNASLQIDSNDNVHLAFLNGTSYNTNLKYASNVSGSWSISELISDYDGGHVSMALDTSDNVHIAYTKTSWLNYGLAGGVDTTMNYITNSTGIWVEKIIDSSGSLSYPDIAVDSAGKVHIVYTETIFDEIKLSSQP